MLQFLARHVNVPLDLLEVCAILLEVAVLLLGQGRQLALLVLELLQLQTSKVS